MRPCVDDPALLDCIYSEPEPSRHHRDGDYLSENLYGVCIGRIQMDTMYQTFNVSQYKTGVLDGILLSGIPLPRWLDSTIMFEHHLPYVYGA